MRKILICLALLMLPLVIVTGSACSLKPSLVGKWQSVQKTNEYIEFLKDKNIIFDNGSTRATGKYELVGDEYVKVNFEGLAGGLLNLFSANTWKYHISGDLMTVEIGNQTLTFQRVK